MTSKTIKKIRLSTEQLYTLKRCIRSTEVFETTLGKILVDAIEEHYERQEDMWNGIARMFGYENLREAKKEKKGFRISWVEEEVHLIQLGCDEDDNKEDCCEEYCNESYPDIE